MKPEKAIRLIHKMVNTVIIMKTRQPVTFEGTVFAGNTWTEALDQAAKALRAMERFEVIEEKIDAALGKEANI